MEIFAVNLLLIWLLSLLATPAVAGGVAPISISTPIIGVATLAFISGNIGVWVKNEYALRPHQRCDYHAGDSGIDVRVCLFTERGSHLLTAILHGLRQYGRYNVRRFAQPVGAGKYTRVLCAVIYPGKAILIG